MRKYMIILVLLIISAISAISAAQFQTGLGLGGSSLIPAKQEVQKNDIAVSARSMHRSLSPGTETLIAVILDISGAGHLYANPNPDGIGLPTELRAIAPEGVKYGEPIYPTGTAKVDSVSGIADMIYDGRTIIYLPVKIADTFTADQLTLELPLRGLECTDTQCLPWSDSTKITLAVGSSPAELDESSADLFAGLSPASYFIEQPAVAEPAVATESPAGLIVANILFAMLAGLIMNVMPCVLPVIPLKVLSIIKQGQQAKESGDNYLAFKLSLAFAAGIILLFAVLGLIMSAFSLAYGQQFQSFTFRLIMFLMVYIMALSMFGLFEIVLPAGLSNLGVVKSGYMGSFMMGIMATLLATPCSAPFLGGVLFWALNQSAAMTLAIFISIGIGMSFPYVVLTAFPRLIDRVPAAGNWMVRLKEGLAFVMLGVAAFLATLFKGEQLNGIIYLAVAVAFGLWLSFQVVNFMTPPLKRILVRLIAVIIIIAVGVFGLTGNVETESSSFADIVRMREQALAQGRPVFMEFTADWCMNCKYVERMVINTNEFQDKLNQTNALFLEVDWTDYDEAITAELNRLGSKSVPFSVVFHPGQEASPILLRDTYSLGSALNALDGKP